MNTEKNTEKKTKKTSPKIVKIYGSIKDNCSECNKGLLDKEIRVLQCGHMFHDDCLGNKDILCYLCL